MTKAQTTTEATTEQTTLEGATADDQDDETTERDRDYRLGGTGRILQEYGERFADKPGEPDVVRAAKWAVRLQEEGVL